MAAALPFVAIGLSALGTGATFLGQMNQPAAQGAQQSYLAQQARQRQMLAEQQAQDAVRRGDIAVQRQRDQTAQRIGTQQAALAAQGTTLEGSPTDILADTSRAGEFDAETIKANAAREAYGYRVQGAGFGADASMRDSFRPSYLGAGASLLMGASGIADKWQRYQYTDPMDGVTAGAAPTGGYGGYPGYANSLPGFS